MHLLNVEDCKDICSTTSARKKEGNSLDVVYFVVLLSVAIMQVQAYVVHLVTNVDEMPSSCKEILYVAYVEPIHKMLLDISKKVKEAD